MSKTKRTPYFRGFRWLWLSLSALCASATAPSQAEVAVIANRTAAPVTVDVLISGEAPRKLALAPGDSRPIIANAAVQVRFTAELATPPRALEAECAYAIEEGTGREPLCLSRIPLGETASPAWASPGLWLVPPSGRVVDVKILVDDDELRPRSVWEPNLRARVAVASAALVAHGGARLRVTAVDVWTSDNGESDFSRALKEFERVVQPGPAEIAIGFSSQYEVAQGRIHLGGTRGTFHSHILVKERAGRVLDAERLEMLTHELGHWLGATHSADPSSVMRPVVGQGLLRAAGGSLQFDPANTLLVALVGEEIRLHGVTKLADVSPATRRRMAEIYAAIDPTLPGDSATAHYLALLNAAAVGPLIKDARHVLEQIARVAQVNQQRPLVVAKADDSGDRLLELYVRQAALAAKQVRRESAPQAFLLALGVAFDNRDALRRLPAASGVMDKIESPSARQDRLVSMGQPTMRDSADFAGQFFAAAYVIAVAGSETARSIETLKQLAGPVGEPTMSFRDLAANRAGIVFAHALLVGRLSLDDVAQRFTIDDFLPQADTLRAELDMPEIFTTDDADAEAQLAAAVTRLEGRLTALPVYNRPTSAE